MTRAGVLLLRWFGENSRKLPWRERPGDPYAILVAETMLQQTRADVVAERFDVWLQAFPTLEKLAEAGNEDVLRAWQGLGYYRRATRLRDAARAIMDSHGGVVPRSASVLRRLPGIGDYTAAAVACIAYNEPVPPLDVNALRVLMRIAGIHGCVPQARARESARRIWHRMLGSNEPRYYAQALMDLGSGPCSQRDPECRSCPVSVCCVAAETGDPARFTLVRASTRAIKVRHVCAVLVDDDRVLVRQCRDGELWAGLWEFPRRALGDAEDAETALRALVSEITEATAVDHAPLPPVRHSVTKYAVTLLPYVVLVRGAASAHHADLKNGMQWMDWASVERLPASSPQLRVRLAVARHLGRTR